MRLRLSRCHCGLAGYESAAAGMAERRLGKHPQVVSAEMMAHENTDGPTGLSSSVRSDLSTAARRAALEVREGSRREVDEGRESMREWAGLA